MFGLDFWPTPPDVVNLLIEGIKLEGKKVLEPQAGKGNIVDRLLQEGAEVIACEINKDLALIVSSKCKLLTHDFLTVESHQVSHIDAIIMNPPFSADERHILHAWEIAPAGCKIHALCNLKTIENPYNKNRKRLVSVINDHGSYQNLGNCFDTAERKTDAIIALVQLIKPGGKEDTEFEGFFMDEDPAEQQENGIMSYNVVRDLVNRYVAAVKLFDKQLDVGVEMHELTNTFFNAKMAFTCTVDGRSGERNEFKKELQKNAWSFIFNKMNMEKYATRGLKEDINKFVEQQQNIPFSMKNIYKMLEIVIGTQSQRMDKALVEVFDKLTEHTEENRHGVEGWKSNSHFLLTKHFIMPWIVDYDNRWPNAYVKTRYGGNREIIDDMQKAICYITGMDYDECIDIGSFCSRMNLNYGQWYSWGFFEIKGHKKGTMHFRFQDENLWGKFNQNIARIKGYPLFEGREQTDYQKRQTGRKKKAA